jgi:hypothetical protein
MKRVPHNNSLGIYTPIGPLGWLSRFGFQRCHGLSIRPDQQEIWSTCGRHLNIHQMLPPFRQTHTVPLSGKGYWLTFAPDSSLAFLALKDKKTVAVMDTRSKKIIEHYQTGEKPKRNIIIPLQ